jgi:hypothetical protein
MNKEISMAGSINTPVASSDASRLVHGSDASLGDAWWRHPMVWLIIAGPLAVVVAGFWTLGIALMHGDPVVIDTGTPAATTGHADVPAQSARNHAATSRAVP